MARLQDKVIFITGGASGVGRECAKVMVREGARVVIGDLDEVSGASAVAELGEANAFFVPQNVANEGDWQRALRSTVDRFGRLDGLVNCAATFPTEDIERTTLERWQATLHVNADGPFLGCKEAIALMKHSGGGSIVNMSSTAALAGHPGMCAYAASKGAIGALTRHVAAHCRAKGYRIRCNSIHPAGIKTAMSQAVWSNLDPSLIDFDLNPASGFCVPNDVANMVLYLMSDESRFVNGAELRLDNALLISVG